MTTETQTFSPPHLHTEWVMVPKEPTEEMLVLGESHMDLIQPGSCGPDTPESRREELRYAWGKMIAAAPPPPVTTREGEDMVHSDVERAAQLGAVTDPALLLDALENLQMYATPGIMKGWVTIPECEWENIFRSVNWPTPDDRTGSRAERDSCLNQTLQTSIDSAVLSAIERCAKVADEFAEEWRAAHNALGLSVALGIATAIRALSTGGKDGL